MLRKPNSARFCAASGLADLRDVRIFLDASVLFSAAKSDGLMHRLLDLLLVNHHALCANAYVIEEARRNLAAKAPSRLPALFAVVARMEVAQWQAHPSTLAELSTLPEKDRPVLAAAIRLRCDALVTGDRAHFGRLYGQTVAGVAIHSPRSLAEMLL
jgi:predicted nucleic acid-binding protein